MRNAILRSAPRRNRALALACALLAAGGAAAQDSLREGMVIGGAAPRESLRPLDSPAADPRADQQRALAMVVDAVGSQSFDRVRLTFSGLVFPNEQGRLIDRATRLLADQGVVADEAAPTVLEISRGAAGYTPERRYVYLRGSGGNEEAQAVLSTEVPFGERAENANAYSLSGMAIAADGAVLWQGAVRAPFVGVDREVAAMTMLEPLIDALGRTVRGAAVDGAVIQPAAVTE